MGQAPEPATHTAASMHLELGNAAARILYTVAKQTWERRCDHLGKIIIPQMTFPVCTMWPWGPCRRTP
jgi:hypothetical protein